MNYDEFKQKYQKVPVEHYPHQVDENPVVSVCVMTYQHAQYINDCLNGILMQKTDFPFEILLGEDASKDGTREICIEYAKKYPEKIRLFLHKRENNIHYYGSPSGKFNLVYNFFMARGKYIALCEGDDYWTDPLKLQKQVDVLEKHNKLVMCTHETQHLTFPIERGRTFRISISVFYRDAQLYGISKLPEVLIKFLFNRNEFWNLRRSHADRVRKEVSRLNDLQDGKWNMSLCSILMRKRIIEPLPDCYLSNAGAHQLTLLLGAMRGGIFHFKEIMAVKRDQETSITADKNRKENIRKTERNIKTNNRIKRYECLKNYANNEQKYILQTMIENHMNKINKKE